MPLFNMHQIRGQLGRDQRLLGLDPGQKTIGLALSDVSLMLASPYGALRRGKLSVVAAEIRRIAAREGVGGLVSGLPLSMDGSFGPAAQAARDWMISLSEQVGLPAAMWDERLSSSAVNRMLIQDADMTRQRRAELVDKLAASYMLQGALDATAE
ncbi:Holliday junction resolvase YqgF [Gluconacetobacter diazotrophicus PA1 5]|uniref:Putative pre-16S rRNA nuclease n=2 Tax=Gluconacetobacter diazotrophicus TaxID=33996 RepID=YQGF_GLUDA|nr:Holliday junction resolvase RuvX [Gluconacetobacter diazotrophicus]A9HRJ3.1 RecName: Full=Putative pre-16S rRNA nuclease [Gluconacetobacter diazotrophicus PA1 5]ACI53096.1 Holliday junction resolvase YqgF [Gluconacetobacter diazotrophicus PA1 5]MBB2155937.1 Holliday junction resolvase RuvX [Gluconacetobacter diazotrophicus]TWB07767.1 putative Holliday junction resolvase [Gluconacetobacter diazotrophicus]CAP56923.1 putative Holliday junction resolvase [Gluconacetobacter diazotrophicus PA1 5]